MRKKTFPELFQEASTGKMKRWKIWVREPEGAEADVGSAVICEEHGLVGGKQIPELIVIDEGKNIGKANETTPWEQAISEAQSKWNKKKDKGYTQKGEVANTSVILPMLAEKYAQRKSSIVFPAFTQPKLNGVRCVVHTDLRYQSRLGKFWTTLTHLDIDLEKLVKEIDAPLDGEAYIHGLNLQDIGSLIKKERLEAQECGYQSSDVEYWIFDQISNDSFKTRYLELNDAFLKLGAKLDMTTLEKMTVLRLGKVVLVPIATVNNHEDIQPIHNQYVAEGFEGTMIRNDAEYRVTHRSPDLQKKKDFLDDEFEITGAKEATGRDKGTAVLRCKTKEGLEFEVRPIGTWEQRADYWKNWQSLVGLKATVRFQELTKDKIPFHGRVMAIRDYE